MDNDDKKTPEQMDLLSTTPKEPHDCGPPLITFGDPRPGFRGLSFDYDALYLDKRFSRLRAALGSEANAIGALIEVWWFASRLNCLVPLVAWNRQDFDKALFDTGWVSLEGDNVRVHNEEQYFEFYGDKVPS